MFYQRKQKADGTSSDDTLHNELAQKLVQILKACIDATVDLFFFFGKGRHATASICPVDPELKQWKKRKGTRNLMLHEMRLESDVKGVQSCKINLHRRQRGGKRKVEKVENMKESVCRRQEKKSTRR